MLRTFEVELVVSYLFVIYSMKEKKLGCSLNYQNGQKHYFRVIKMWPCSKGKGFIGFGEHFHTMDRFRIWSEKNFYPVNGPVCCCEIIDIDLFKICDHTSEIICDMGPLIDQYQPKFTILTIPEGEEYQTELFNPE